MYERIQKPKAAEKRSIAGSSRQKRGRTSPRSCFVDNRHSQFAGQLKGSELIQRKTTVFAYGEAGARLKKVTGESGHSNYNESMLEYLTRRDGRKSWARHFKDKLSRLNDQSKDLNYDQYCCAEPNAVVELLNRGVDLQSIVMGKAKDKKGPKEPCGWCKQWLDGSSVHI